MPDKPVTDAPAEETSRIENVSQTHDPPADPIETDLTCPECDYNLTGAPGDRCPWCGWRIDVEELVASVTARRSKLRWGIVAAALFVGAGSFIGVGVQLSHGVGLSWRDGLAVMAVLVAALGHMSLAATIALSRRQWPVRANELATILRFVGWLSIISSVIAATSILQDQSANAPAPRIVRGVVVNGVLEFILTGLFYSLPGIMLLTLRLVSFRQAGESLLSRFAGRPTIENEVETGAPFLVEIEGRFAAGHLSQDWVDTPRPTMPHVEEMISRAWEVESNLAGQAGRNLYNGRLARLIRAESSTNELRLRLGDTCYRDFLGTNVLNAAEVAKIDPELFSNAVGTSATVRTRDGLLVLGRRSERVAFHGGYLHSFGGMLESADRRSDGYDIFGGVKREVMEELGVNDGEIGDVVLIGLVRDRTILQPEILFDLDVTMNRAELSERFDPQLSDGEHSAIEFVPDDPDAVVRFLLQAKPIAAVAQAGLLLHGKHQWGKHWYDQSCHLLYGSLPARHGVT